MINCYWVWVLFCLHVIEALRIEGQLSSGREETLNLGLDRPRVVLNDGDFQSTALLNGTFILNNIPDGTYLLTVWSTTHVYPALLLKVSQDSTEQIRPYPYDYDLDYPKDYFDEPDVDMTVTTFSRPRPLAYPLRLGALRKFSLTHKRAQYNPMTMLKSPIVLMMLGSICLLFLLPKIMANLDPEEAAKMKDSQNKLAAALQGGDWKSALSGMMEQPKLEKVPDKNVKALPNSVPPSARAQQITSPPRAGGHHHQKSKKRR